MDDSCHVALLVLLVDHRLADSIWTVTADPSPRFITAIRSTVLSALGWLILVWLCVLRVCVIWGHMSAHSLCPVGEIIIIIIIIGSYWHPADMHTLQFKPGLHCINSECQRRNFTVYYTDVMCVKARGGDHWLACVKYRYFMLSCADFCSRISGSFVHVWRQLKDSDRCG